MKSSNLFIKWDILLATSIQKIPHSTSDLSGKVARNVPLLGLFEVRKKSVVMSKTM